MKYQNRCQYREVTETMTSLLLPLRNHCDEKTKRCIDDTISILLNTEIVNESISESEK